LVNNNNQRTGILKLNNKRSYSSMTGVSSDSEAKTKYMHENNSQDSLEEYEILLTAKRLCTFRSFIYK
jgi:hypothetical protein